MKKIFKIGIILFLFAFFFLLFFYIDIFSKLNCREENFQCNKFEELSLEFNGDIISIFESFEDVAKNLEKLYDKKYYDDIDKSKYFFNGNNIFVNKFDEKRTSIFATGLSKIDDNLLKTIYFTEKIEFDFINFFNENSMISQIYYNEKHSYNRTYPPFKAEGLVEVEMDLTKYIFFYKADEKNNFERKTVLLNEPYLDPAGIGWTISVIKPIYNKNEFQGVLGFDFALNKLDRVLENFEKTMIINSNGTILSASNDIYNFLGVKKIATSDYYSPINNNVFLPDEYNLNHNKENSIRLLWKKIIDNKIFKGEISVLDKDVFYCAVYIEKIDSYIIHLFY